MSQDLVLCTDGPARLRTTDLERLAQHGIAVRQDRIARLEGKEGILERVVFANGDTLARRALFFNTGQRQRWDFATRLGCELTPQGRVRTSRYEATTVPGVYVAGDAERGLELAILAAAEGVRAAFAINTALLKEDLGHRAGA